MTKLQLSGFVLIGIAILSWTLLANRVVNLGGVAGGTLTTDLISYWSFDEASGGTAEVVRADSHSDNDLSDPLFVASGTGIIGNGCDFENSQSRYFIIADPHDFYFPGNADFTVSLWWRPESVAADQALVCVFATTGNNRQYRLMFFNTDDTIGLQVSSTGTGATEVTVAGAVVTTNTWYHIVAGHDGVNDELFVIVDDGTPATIAHSAGLHTATAEFDVGHRTAANKADGIMDEFGIWSRVLTSSEITQLYNSGSGLAYGSF
jgi:hypothetical protein